MRKENTLRRTMTFFLILALILPMIGFAVLAQFRIWRVSDVFVEDGMQKEIEYMENSLNLILNQYQELLYEFSTNEEVIDMVEEVERRPDEREAVMERLNRRLSRLCSQNEGIEGATLVTQSGDVFFYDRKMSSSAYTTWVDRIQDTEDFVTPQFHGVTASIQTGGGTFHIYRISRNLVDYQDMSRKLGTVTLSVNTDTLQMIVNPGEDSMAFICEGGKVIAAGNETEIGTDIDRIAADGFRTKSITNTMSGWTIHVYHALGVYQDVLWNQTVIWVFATVILMALLVLVIMFITRPLIQKVDDLVEAMNLAEEGNFAVRVEPGTLVTSEIKRIVLGFNTMVKKNGELFEQAKQSAIEQKNAELSAMEAQIDPHFLYNTLDAINWKALDHGEYEISSMVGALADILRYSIRNPGDMVSIGQELYWLEQYVSLQGAKLDHRPTLKVEVSEDVKRCRIHKLLLQPFAENAIKHGMYYDGICEIKISMHLSHSQIHIVIQDNGLGITAEVLKKLNDHTADMNEHVGVANVRKRLSLYYGDNANLYFESKKGEYTKVHLFVPEIRGQEEKK